MNLLVSPAPESHMNVAQRVSLCIHNGSQGWCQVQHLRPWVQDIGGLSISSAAHHELPCRAELPCCMPSPLLLEQVPTKSSAHASPIYYLTSQLCGTGAWNGCHCTRTNTCRLLVISEGLRINWILCPFHSAEASYIHRAWCLPSFSKSATLFLSIFLPNNPPVAWLHFLLEAHFWSHWPDLGNLGHAPYLELIPLYYIHEFQGSGHGQLWMFLSTTPTQILSSCRSIFIMKCIP